jgi:molybdenum cofactor synthesis domain-containing protein
MAMKPLKALISLEEGLRILLSLARPLERIEAVDLLDAVGRVLTEDLVADLDVPPFPRAAMDGYALRAEETYPAGQFNPVPLELIEVIHAGEVAREAVRPGTCIQVATGSPIPAGADAVLQVEETEIEGDQVRVYRSVPPRTNIMPRGQDIAAGRVVLPAGAVLTPSRIGVLAALGRPRASVYARPVVAIIPSGNEIVAPGEPLGPGQIYDVNTYTLAALVREHGCLPRLFPIMADTLEAVKGTIKRALECDLIVLSGGSSVGERDMMVQALEEMGEVFFHGIAVKPGKPTLCARVEERPVIGMPGYPTSCLTNGYGLLLPVVRVMTRLPARAQATARGRMARRTNSTIGRHQYLPVRLAGGEVESAFKESGAITSMADADGMIEIPANVDLVEKGEAVEVLLF